MKIWTWTVFKEVKRAALLLPSRFLVELYLAVFFEIRKNVALIVDIACDSLY